MIYKLKKFGKKKKKKIKGYSILIGIKVFD